MTIASSTDGWGSPSFTSSDSLNLMWEYARYFITQYMPIIMIVASIFIAIAVTVLITNIFSNRKGEEEDPVEYL